MLICLLLFIVMALVILLLQFIAKQKAKKTAFQEYKKAILRMTDVWFKNYYAGCVANNWQNVSRKGRRFVEEEAKRRKIDLNSLF